MSNNIGTGPKIYAVESSPELGPIRTSITISKTRLDSLGQAIDVLFSKLDPILAAQPPTTGEACKSPEPSCPIHSNIEQINERIEVSERLIRDMISRVML